MSQTTSCPACQTLFKVVPDQLRVSEGWVRCGQCSEIFDAHLHIYKEPFAASSPQEIAPAVAYSERVVNSLKTEPTALRVVQEAGSAAVVPSVSGSVVVPDSETTLVIDRQEDANRVNRVSWSKPQLLSDFSPQVTFLNEPKRNSFWQYTRARTLLIVSGMGLASALALQVTVHQRDRIAATSPAIKPALEGLCQVLGCRVLPVRQIESMVIDGSTFIELRGNAYRLGFTVRNIALIDLAMPAIELTLTDPQDRAAVRRVFLPAEMGATSAVLGAGAEWTGSLVLSVRTQGGSERISGYRIAALYP